MSKRARATPLRDEKRLSGSGATGVSGTIGRRSIKPLALKKRDLKKLAKSYPALRKKSGGNLFLSSEKNSLEVGSRHTRNSRNKFSITGFVVQRDLHVLSRYKCRIRNTFRFVCQVRSEPCSGTFGVFRNVLATDRPGRCHVIVSLEPGHYWLGWWSVKSSFAIYFFLSLLNNPASCLIYGGQYVWNLNKLNVSFVK